jgi:hypothetical protein
VVAALAATVALAGCGGGGQAAPAPPTSAPSVTRPATTTTTTVSIDGVETFPVTAAHVDGPISYPQVPPVGGAHNPVWQTCTFYDAPVPSEKAVHSLEHGAVWITYRPDLPAGDVDTIATLARSRKDVLASRWDDGLPAPLVATAWGRQLRLQSASDPRLAAFVRQYAGKGPEPNAPC